IMKYLRTGKTVADVLISLVAAMLARRAAMGALNALIFRAGEYSFAVWFATLFATALPGIVIQLVLIPILIIALERAKVLPGRYPAQG
ncbi:MAG TPA: ECF transporter S component, partial [Clostridia bacterium]|nr:ECF transporter S component [Clostridia bacterium]